MSAGAILTVMRDMGKSSPVFFIEALTRSRLYFTDASGKPTISNLGNPELMSAST